MLSRDYMTVKLWDINMENRPIASFPVHEPLREKARSPAASATTAAARPRHRLSLPPVEAAVHSSGAAHCAHAFMTLATEAQTAHGNAA